MKKGNFSKVLLLVLVIMAMTAVLAITSSAENIIYKSKLASTADTAVTYLNSSNKATTDPAEYVDTGIRYSVVGTVMTLSGSCSKDATWVVPLEYRNVITEVVVGDGILGLSGNAFLKFSKLKKVTVSDKLVKLQNNCLRECSALQTFCVAGTGLDYPGVCDLRWITSYGNWALGMTKYNGGVAYVYLSDTLLNSYTDTKNYFGSGSGTNGQMTVYANFTEDDMGQDGKYNCNWAQTIIDTGRKWDITCLPFPKPAVEKKAVSHLGYQVRTKSYNGLRGVFTVDTSVINEGCTLVEWGTIAASATNESTYGHELTKSGDKYVTANEKIKKIAVSDDFDPAKEGNTFHVSVVRYGSEHLKDKVFMTGYEIWRSIDSGEDYIIYTCDEMSSDKKVANTSIFEATIGMYKAGLINKRVEEDGVFESVLKYCREPLTLGGTARESGATYSFDDTNTEMTMNSFKVSVYKTGEGENVSYTAIVNGKGKFYSDYRFVGGTDKTKNRFNPLSEEVIGSPVDTVIIDDGITFTGDMVFSYLRTLENIVLAESVKEIKFSVAYDANLTSLVSFNSKKAVEDPNYVANAKYTLDFSDIETITFSSWATSGVTGKLISKIILPVPSKDVDIGEGTFYNLAKDLTVYVKGNGGAAGTIDLRSPAGATGQYTAVKFLPRAEDGLYYMNSFFTGSTGASIMYLGDKVYKRSGSYWDIYTPPVEVTGPDFTNVLPGDKEEVSIGDKVQATRLTGNNNILIDASKLSFGGSDMLVFSFLVKADECTELTVSFDKNGTGVSKLDYPIPAQWSELKVPIHMSEVSTSYTADQLTSIELNVKGEGSILVAEAGFENLGTKKYIDVAGDCGMFLKEDFTDVHLIESDFTDGVLNTKYNTVKAGLGSTQGIAKRGNYIYAVGSTGTGSLTVLDVTNPDSPVKKGSVKGLGQYTRNVDVFEDGKHVMVVSRELGAYVINVEDPMNPYIVSTFDTVESATGILISGNYALVSERTYGIEVIDISDPAAPKHVGTVPSGEVQNLTVHDNLLYAGIWGGRRVDIYDISDVYHPVVLGVANLHGKGDGVSVLEVGDKKYLYAAIGHQQGSDTVVTKLGLGQGNGFDIFDVTDPTNPVWCSTSYIDGRFYALGQDFWRTHAAIGTDGKVYAYISNTYNGAYIYDVTDPCAPVRLFHADVKRTGTPIDETQYLVPYDQSTYINGVIGDVLCDGERFYVAGTNSDLYIMNIPGLMYNAPYEKCYLPEEIEGPDYAFSGEGLSNFKSYMTEGQVMTVRPYGDYLYLAAGRDGIIVLDNDFNEVKRIVTGTTVYDVELGNGLLYSAEGLTGLVGYELDQNGIPTGNKLWTYKHSGKTIDGTWATTFSARAIQLSPLGKYAVVISEAQGGSILELDNVTGNHTVLYHKHTSPLMYHHNICGEVMGDGYLVFTGHGKQMMWFKFTDDGHGNESYEVCTGLNNIFATHSLSMLSNVSAFGADKAIMMTSSNSGYAVFDPANPGVTKAADLTIYGKTAVGIAGKPTVSSDGKWLIVTNRQDRIIKILDVTDPANPVLKKEFDIVGNPDIARILGNPDDGYYALIPLGHGGLVRFDLNF